MRSLSKNYLKRSFILTGLSSIMFSFLNVYASGSGVVSKEAKPVNSIDIQTNENTSSRKYSDSWSIRFIQKRNEQRMQQKREQERQRSPLSVKPFRVQEKISVEPIPIQEKKSLKKNKISAVPADHSRSLNLSLKVNNSQEGSVIKASNRQTIDEVIRDLRNLRRYSNGPEVSFNKDCNKHIISQAKPTVTNLAHKPSSRVVTQKNCALRKIKKHPLRDIHTTGRTSNWSRVSSPKLPFKRNISMGDFLDHHKYRPCRLRGSRNCKSWDFTFVKVGTPTSSWYLGDVIRAEMYAPRPFRVLTAGQALKPGASRGPNPVFIQDVKTGAIMQIIHNDEIPRAIREAAGTGKVFPGGTLIAYQGNKGRGIKYVHFDIQSTDSQFILDMIRANMFGEYEICSEGLI